MSIKVSIPTIMRSLTGNQKVVEASGVNVLQLIESLDQRFPGLSERLITDGQAHRFVNIYVNDEDIRFADQLATALTDGDSVTILPAVAGGGPT